MNRHHMIFFNELPTAPKKESESSYRYGAIIPYEVLLWFVIKSQMGTIVLYLTKRIIKGTLYITPQREYAASKDALQGAAIP
jgi:hypothetical protein